MCVPVCTCVYVCMCVFCVVFVGVVYDVYECDNMVRCMHVKYVCVSCKVCV